MPDTDPRLLSLNADDNVLIVRQTIDAGENVLIDGTSVRVDACIELGHKLARRPIETGEKIIKYGAPIGSATRSIATGEHVHLANLKSDYTPSYSLEPIEETRS